ncbi:cysteine desulfurase family protein [Candidatus Binatus soli]|jgi:cysteine desulfurase|uniref:cysteine desulfurase family protein n=1 Tax=Candidatus Binatus soli TaxID=1953413 RepID=UPI003D14A19F
MPIYLDHNAGAPVRVEAAAAVSRLPADMGGNPSSVHRSGQRSRRMLEVARAQVASIVGAEPRQIVFTSGGTESNNLAIFGGITAASRRRKIISSQIEHSSILAPIAELERRGFEVVRVAPDSDGRVDPGRVLAALDSETALVTLGLANSEVGTIQDLAPLASMCGGAGALFHIDAAQAVGRIPVDIAALGCDLLTLSGHKLGAHSGVGALYVRDFTRVAPIVFGGPHESGMRAGTPNLLGAVSFGAAAEAAMNAMAAESVRIGSLAASLFARIREAIPGLRLNGPIVGRLPNTLNLTFPGVLGESMLIALDLEGVEVSMGSACAAGAVEPSHVLRAMGRSVADARSSLRISLGWNNTAQEIEAVAALIPQVWRRVAASEPLSEASAR